MGGGLINFPTRFLRWIKIDGDADGDDRSDDGGEDTTDKIANLIKILTFGQCSEYEIEETQDDIIYTAKIPTNIPSVQLSSIKIDIITERLGNNGVGLFPDPDYNPYIELNNTQLGIEDLFDYEYVIFGNKSNIYCGVEDDKTKFISIPVILKRSDIDTDFIYFTGQNWGIECMPSSGYIQANMAAENITITVEH